MTPWSGTGRCRLGCCPGAWSRWSSPAAGTSRPGTTPGWAAGSGWPGEGSNDRRRSRMSQRTEYAPGEFRWVDLSTPDVDGALSFYGELLGVEGQPAPGDPEETGGYGFLTKDGKMIAGYGTTQREDQPAWSS